MGIQSYAKIPKRSGTVLYLVLKAYTLQHLWLAPGENTHFAQKDTEFSDFLFRINKESQNQIPA